MSTGNKVSEHYLGARGAEYVESRQSEKRDELGYLLNFEHFEPHLRPTDVVLDFGAGNGGMLKLLKGKVARAEGLEVNPTALEIARRMSGCTVYPSIDALPNVPTYNAIVTNHVLEHVRDVCGTIEQLRSRLLPGGIIIVKVPAEEQRTAYSRSWSRDDIDHHLHTWTPRLFANTLFEAGYDVRESRLLTTGWHPRLFFLRRFGLDRLAFWALAVVRHRRQIFAIGVNPQR